MTTSEISFERDLAELTSATNFIVGIAVPIIIALIAVKDHIILTILIMEGILLLLIAFFFFIRWLFFYRRRTKYKPYIVKDKNK